MDTFHRDECTGTWRRLFSRVKKHIIWGVLKSVTGMQGKKFKDKAHSSTVAVPESDLNLSDSDGGSAEKSDQNPMTWPKRPVDGAEFSPFARQLTITEAKRLIRRHTKKFRSRTQKGGLSFQQKDSLPESPKESTPFETFESDSSSGSDPYEDFSGR